MSLVVTKGGVLGSNVEHSRWDGTFMSWVSPHFLRIASFPNLSPSTYSCTFPHLSVMKL